MTPDLAIPDLSHPSWQTAIGTVVGYGLILAVLTVVLFGGAWFVFWLL